jgi:zinc protease
MQNLLTGLLLTRLLLTAAALFSVASCAALGGKTTTAAKAPAYAVVVSLKTFENPDWRGVVETLEKKHKATRIVYASSVDEALPKLRERFPRYACFVAQPAEASRKFVVAVHRLTRKLNDDPYTDCFWGILTGYDAANALRIARCVEPLTVRRVAAGTDVALDMCEEGVWYSELKQGEMVRKEKGGKPRELKGPADTTEALAKTLTDYKADLFVTSGHATERDWQIGYSYRNGQFRCENGALYGLDTAGRKIPIESPNPKVFMPIGNCLMGHIVGPDAMALAYMNSGGVNQMLGYVVSTWFGYAGWGCLDYFVEQPGRYTFTEAFFANQMALQHRLGTFFPELVSAESDENGATQTNIQLSNEARKAGLTANDGRGLLFDRDYVAFYGDPAWEARMAKQDCAWDQTLEEKGGVFTFEIKPNRGADTFKPINTNGSQRGGRPIVQFLPRRVRDVRILEGADLAPVIADNFILVPNPGKCDPRRKYRVVFQATPVEAVGFRL